MADYEKKVINGFVKDIHETVSTPAGENLFQVRQEEERVRLVDERAQCFHSMVA